MMNVLLKILIGIVSVVLLYYFPIPVLSVVVGGICLYLCFIKNLIENDIQGTIRYLQRKRWLFQADIFIIPDILEIGRVVKKQTKNAGLARYNDFHGKKYKDYNLGRWGYYLDYKRDRGNGRIFTPHYDFLSQKIDIPLRITQIYSDNGELRFSFDSLEKEIWQSEYKNLCFNYCASELKDENNIITFLPFRLQHWGYLVLDVIEGDRVLDYWEQFFKFPLKSVIYDMIKQCKCILLEQENGKFDNETCVNFYKGTIEKLNECEFECSHNDCWEIAFQNKYGSVGITIRAIDDN